MRELPTPGWSHIFYLELFGALGGFVNSLKEKLVQTTNHISYLMAGFLKSHLSPQREWSSGRAGKRDPSGWWLGAEIQIHTKRRSLQPEHSSNNHGDGEQAFLDKAWWVWLTWKSQLMETAPRELLKEAMVQDSSWLIHFTSAFDGSGRNKQPVLPTACPSSNAY